MAITQARLLSKNSETYKMKLEQRQWVKSKGWVPERSDSGFDANLVFVFGETQALKQNSFLEEMKIAYPKAQIFGCSTAGEIQGTRVYDDTICTTAIHFSKTKVQSANIHLVNAEDSFQGGQRLANLLDHENLTHVFVLSAGLNVNGSDLVKGMTSVLPKNVALTGGLAGDKANFKETLVISNGTQSSDLVAAVGLYGNNIKIGSASLGGWDPFGPKRTVTKSQGNVLYGLDGKSALDLYKTYLGEHAKDLPGSALLFPLSMRTQGSNDELVRTILAVDEKEQSMTFAGDIPEGAKVQLMKANFDRLIDGAIGAAELSQNLLLNSRPEFALLVSCVGRKLILKQRVEEEVEGVQEILGSKTVMTGFYSYGEISPSTTSTKCELHNQTMTITTLVEDDDAA